MSLTRKVAVNASALATGRALQAAAGVVGVGIAARYLGLDSYGHFITATAFVAIFASLTDLGLWTIGARELARRPDEERQLLGAMFTIGLGLSIVAAAVALGVGYAVYSGPEDAEVRHALTLLVLVGLPFGAPVSATGAYFVAHQRSYVGAVAALGATVATLGALALAVGLDWGYTGVVVAYSVNGVAFAIFLLGYSLRRVPLRPSLDLPLIRQLTRSALPLGGNLVLTSLYWKLDIILLSLLASSAQVAVYGVAFKVVDALLVLPTYVTITLLPEFARLSEQRARLGEVLQKAMTLMQVAVAPMLVFFLAFAGEVATVIGGHRFESAGGLIRILVIGVGAGYLTAVILQALVAIDLQNRMFLGSVLLLPVNIVLNLALIPPLGANGAAIAFSATEVAALGLFGAMYARHAELPRPHRLVRVTAAAALSALAVFVGAGAVGDALTPVGVLVVGGALVGLLYAGGLYALAAMPAELERLFAVPLRRLPRPRRVPG